MTSSQVLRRVCVSGCLVALLSCGCAHWGWKQASHDKLSDVVDGGEASFVETSKPKSLSDPTAKATASTASTAVPSPITRTPEDEALINDTLARLRTLPDMTPEQVDEIARTLQDPHQPTPRLVLQHVNGMAKQKQAAAQKEKAAAAATATAAAAPAVQPKQPALVQASAVSEKPAPQDPPSAEEPETEPATKPLMSPPRRLIDRVRRAKEQTEEPTPKGIFDGKVGAHVAPRIDPDTLAVAHVTQKPATIETSATVEEAPELTWKEHLTESISRLESEIKDSELEPVEAARRAAQLRLLYLAADRNEDALRDVTGLDSHEQAYWRNQVSSLTISLASEGSPVKGRRASLALRPLRDAVDELAAQATLDVRNVTLCKSVTIWGNYTAFEDYSFKPNQEVLLYFEVENYASEHTSSGYATEFLSSYEIFDSAGRRVAEQQFPIAQETCKNRRRDYFIRYHFHVPKTLAAGDYVLQLTVEDQKGHKFGQGSAKFKVSG